MWAAGNWTPRSAVKLLQSVQTIQNPFRNIESVLRGLDGRLKINFVKCESPDTLALKTENNQQHKQKYCADRQTGS